MTERENILIDALISAGHIAEQARTAMEKLKSENAELRHRAEVAERALRLSCTSNAIFDGIDLTQRFAENILYRTYLQFAEKELAEEGKDD